MGARLTQSSCSNESGQSVIEFMLMLPLMLALTVLLVKMNTAIQMSIVNQQYARAQLTFLTFNSSSYPQRKLVKSLFERTNSNRMIIGVAENSFPPEGTAAPEASTYTVARNSKRVGADPPQDEPRQRAKVRIRDTVEMCTQNNFASVGGKPVPVDSIQLNESATFQYCRSNLDR